MRAESISTLPDFSKDTLVMLLAGGQGNRLHELTQARAKPGIEFGGSYKIIDFPLSNCVNSGLRKIGVVTQYKAQCLLRHLVRGWSQFNQNYGEFLELLPASQQFSDNWYRGTADALYQNIQFIKAQNPKRVLVLSGDHIYKMDYRSMLAHHLENDASLTVSCIEVPVAKAAGQFGVMHVNNEDRILSFEEKPKNPAELADAPGYALASMGNYVFDTAFLLEQLEADASDASSEHDFGKNIIPKLLGDHKVQAYRFRSPNNDNIPYWRDVGTLEAYWQANMALLESNPQIELDDTEWPIWSHQRCLPPVRFLSEGSSGSANITDSVIAGGGLINSSVVHHSMLFEQVQVGMNASIHQSILLPEVQVGEGVVLRKVIVDKGCHIPNNLVIGVDIKDDIKRGFRVTPNGLVLVTQAMLDTLNKDVKSPKIYTDVLPDVSQVHVGVSRPASTLSMRNKHLCEQKPFSLADY